MRQYTLLDQICLGVDQALRTISGQPQTTQRPYPAENIPEAQLSPKEMKHAAGLMRVNHAGEVCAQALYHAQGLVSKSRDTKYKMQQAAMEEGDHLAWCHQRLTELGSHKSYLNPLWYGGSFVIGLTAGLVGDKWSLGFLAETEYQVVMHLEKQLDLLPTTDQKSHVVLQKMCEDEAQHRDDALHAGGVVLPVFIKKLMGFSSKIMVKTAYWI